MLVICVQSVYRINQTEKIKPCQKHTSQKRENAQKLMVSWCDQDQKLDETPCLDEGERDARLCRQLANKKL